jgi:hypothetical protein
MVPFVMTVKLESDPATIVDELAELVPLAGELLPQPVDATDAREVEPFA